MIWLLLLVYQMKHFMCDYPMQNQYMLGKFKPYPDYILPLLAHSGLHGLSTLLIAWAAGSKIPVLLGILDMAVHFTVDRVKASPTLGGRFKPLTKDTYPNSTEEQKHSNTLFWWSLGADQMAHHLTHYFIIWCLV